ncbi:MAG: FAD/NAD(P)-binding protein [Geminicoccaceae bacterium]
MIPSAATTPSQANAAVIVGAADPMLPSLARVVARRQELGDTWTIELEVDDPDLLAFRPGQFNMLYAPGVGEVAISVSGDAVGTERLVHTIRDVGKVSHALASLEPGMAVGVRGPFGTAWPVEAAEGTDVVIVSGGLGLAPLRPAIYHILSHRERYGRVTILAGARGVKGILFPGQLAEWRRHLDLQIEITVDHADTNWQGHVGMVTNLIPRANFDPADTTALVCGPEIMMRFAANAIHDAGVAEDAIYLSMERHMKCGLGHCGRCQYGPYLVCRDGPVMSYDRLKRLLTIKEL